MRINRELIIFIITIFCVSNALSFIERRGPQFLIEPENTVSFLNDTGTVITCKAKGIPQPTIKWIRLDGSPLQAVEGLTQFRIDGQTNQLVFLPFSSNNYRQDVHSVSVRCLATNSIGTVQSRDSHIRASVKQSYEVQVYDDFVIKGNTGILRCHIPSFVREYVSVTNWLTSDGMQVYSNLANGGRFSVLPVTGELHIHRVDPISDSQKQYRCQTKHKLNAEVKLSTNSGALIVTETHSTMPPKIITTSRYIVAIVGETVELVCSTQGYPRPEFKWFKINFESKALDRVSTFSSSSKILQIDGSLIVRHVTIDDSAKYVCIANNSAGEDRFDTELLVRAPLNVILTPSHILVSDSESVTLNCSVQGFPIKNIYWKKNANNLLFSNRINLFNDRSLHISHVKRDDRGMYQCIARNEFESVVASAEIALRDDPPMFSYVFDQTLPIKPSQSLSLKCSAIGLPLPQIVWTLDGQPISEHLRLRVGDYVTSDGTVNSYVNISSVKTEDGGIYACIASNDVHSITHSSRVNVYGPPFVRHMSNRTAIAGHNIQIQCPSAGYPIDSIVWYKKSNGKLPQNHRQKTLSNGTLIISKIDRQTDEDMYRCVANASNSSSYADVFVKVLVAPVINPFTASPNLREGMRGMLTCSVIEGDTPITIQFVKDGIPLNTTSDGNIKIDQNNPFSSTLLISRVSDKDSGNYTCIASNIAAKMSYSVQLTVNDSVPPKWIVSPADTEAIVGQNVIMDCMASGQSRIWWERAMSEIVTGVSDVSHTDSHSHQFRSIISNSHMHTLENGSLTIREVSHEDSGDYLCQASNGVANGLSKVISLKVHVPAHFKSKFSAQTIRKSQQLLIMCEAYGENPISIIVSKDRMQFDPSLEPRYHFIKQEKSDGYSITLKIANSDRRDSALFTCIAANSYGKDEYNIQVLVQEPPDKPENVLISQIESRSAIISWISAYSGNSAIISYELEYKVLATDWSSSEKIEHTVIGSVNSLTIRGIKPITDYQLRIRAQNKLGFSDWTQSLQFKTTEEAPSGPPLNIHVFPLSARSLQITFTAPNIESRNGRIMGYYLGYKVHESDSQYIFKTVTISDNTVNDSNQLTEVKLTELKRSTKYSIIVQSYNSKGSGPQSTEVIGETLENDPPKAPILSLEEVRYKSIKLNWKIDDMEDVISVISGYYIYSKHQHSEWHEKHLIAPINSYAFTELLCGTQYQFYIVAYNSVGKGDPSQAIAVKTKGSVALPPQRTHALMAVNTTSAILKLDSWITNGCDIKQFIIKYKSKYDKEWSVVSNDVLPQQRFIELIDLMPANWYEINVMAVTDAGNTEQRYHFATLTPNGATVSPLDMSESVSYNSSIMIPFICSVIVLTVILIIACFVITRKRPLFGLDNNNSVHNCNAEAHHLNTADEFHLSVLEPNKQINCSDANCAAKSAYFPTPYAMSSVQRPTMCCNAESELSSLNSLRHSRHEQHVYEMPFPPKWV